MRKTTSSSPYFQFSVKSSIYVFISDLLSSIFLFSSSFNPPLLYKSLEINEVIPYIFAALQNAKNHANSNTKKESANNERNCWPESSNLKFNKKKWMSKTYPYINRICTKSHRRKCQLLHWELLLLVELCKALLSFFRPTEQPTVAPFCLSIFRN